MKLQITMVETNETNLSKFPPACFMNYSHPGCSLKQEWVRSQFNHGLKIKHLFVKDERKSVGFIEYIDGEHCWRAVQASGYLFIHCLWVTPNKYKKHGLGSLLLADCCADAELLGKRGVAVVAGNGSFIADKSLFLKNGFVEVATTKSGYSLLVKMLQSGDPPYFTAWEAQLARVSGFQLLYSNQCPWVARAIPELQEVAAEAGVALQVTELKSPKEAQNAPSIYGVFNLIYDGKLLADHYISTTRFKNILKKLPKSRTVV